MHTLEEIDDVVKEHTLAVEAKENARQLRIEQGVEHDQEFEEAPIDVQPATSSVLDGEGTIEKKKKGRPIAKKATDAITRSTTTDALVQSGYKGAALALNNPWILWACGTMGREIAGVRSKRIIHKLAISDNP